MIQRFSLSGAQKNVVDCKVSTEHGHCRGGVEEITLIRSNIRRGEDWKSTVASGKEESAETDVQCVAPGFGGGGRYTYSCKAYYKVVKLRR